MLNLEVTFALAGRGAPRIPAQKPRRFMGLSVADNLA
jgi:hypothetical protein